MPSGKFAWISTSPPVAYDDSPWRIQIDPGAPTELKIARQCTALWVSLEPAVTVRMD